MTVTLLTPGRATSIDGEWIEGERVWIPCEGMSRALGVELATDAAGRALCRGSTCVRAPREAGWLAEQDGRILVELGAVARALGQALVASPDRRVWSLSLASGLDGIWRKTLQAPEVELPDRAGTARRLSGFRGRKVVLLTWASW